MIEQIGIAICGVTAVWLSQDTREHWRRFACIFGLAAQPFWFWTTWVNQQWGIMALCLFYGYGWWRGFRQFWLR